MFLTRLPPALLILHLILSIQADNSTSPEVAKENKTEIHPPETKVTPAENVTQSVSKLNLDNVLEGGKVSGNINGEVKVSSTTETTRPYGREHVTEASTTSKASVKSTSETIVNVQDKSSSTGIKNVTTEITSSSTQPTSSSTQSSISSIHVTNNSTNVTNNSMKVTNNNMQVTSSTGSMSSSTDGNKTTKESISSTTEKIIPISEKIDTKMDHKKTVPKKGVNFTETLENMTFNKSTSGNLTSTTTPIPSTTKAIPKKPLITVGNDEEPFAPSNFVPGKVNGTNQKVPSIESFENNNRSRSGPDYIVPIVGVILSVPLVAILLNAVYKRTKEWWHHRHYSRMDFLIDGMYNN